MPQEEEDLSRAEGLVSDYLTVLDAHILRESDKWITAVVGVESSHGKKSLRFYRWKKVEGEWKKVSSFNVKREGDWAEVKEAGDGIASKVWGGT